MNELEKSNSKNLTFEDFKNENGIAYWWASDIMLMLGYSDMKSFKKVLDKVTLTFMNLNISHYDNIISEKREDEEKQDFKLTRFACYLSAMNADNKKPQVAMAQRYFAEQTRKYELSFKENNDITRIHTRAEIIEAHKGITSSAHKANVKNYANFLNAGYLGMYNMSTWHLARKRGIEKKKLIDHMGRVELAANLFRLSITDERIKNREVKGQRDLEQTHHSVGKEVRNMVIKNVGIPPEELRQERQLPEVKKELKTGYRKMIKEDKKK